MEENERQKSTTRPWHINGASEAGRRKEGGFLQCRSTTVGRHGRTLPTHSHLPPPHTHSSNRGRNGRCPTGNFYRRRSSDMKSSIGSRGPGRDRRDQMSCAVVCATHWDDQRCSRHGCQSVLTGVLTCVRIGNWRNV